MYSNLDKYEMTLRQMRVDMGQGRGNALSNAVEWVKGNHIYEKLTEGELQDKMDEYWDKFFYSSQTKISEDFDKWLADNKDALMDYYKVKELLTEDPDKIIDLDKEKPF
jgi:hypothetical protein